MKKTFLAVTFGLLLTLGVTQAQTIVRIAPPPPPRVVVPVSPGPRYVWVGGYYGYRGNAYVWMPGHYVIPPRPYAVWVPGRWVRGPNGYYWVAGHWR
jgi:hypothetical protein